MHEVRPLVPLADSAGTGAGDSPTDAQLLQRFASHKDQAAFAALVERHGRLVLGVCRRVLRSAEDAEDAFQATFLVLARKAGAIRDPELLANWLYGVASRIARKARASVSQRQMHENQARLLATLTAPPPPEEDLGPVLDEELSRLPEKYRAALVLCYLQGMTNEEAARLLRWPVGTVKGRMAKGRQLLRNRLLRRGVRTSGALLAAFLVGARARAGSVPAPLSEAAIHAGVSFVGGEGSDSPPSPRAVRLADFVLRPARWAPLIAGAVLLALLVAGAAGRWLDLATAGPPPPTAPACHSYGEGSGTDGSAAGR